MKNLTKLILILFTTFFSIGCSKDNTDSIACTGQIVPAYIKFNVVDDVTGQDLFFSANPVYNTDQIKFRKTTDTNNENPIVPEVIGSGNDRYFKMQINNTQKRDTLIMLLPVSPVSLPLDAFSYSIKKTEDICPVYIFDNGKFNGEEIVLNQERLIFKINR